MSSLSIVLYEAFLFLPQSNLFFSIKNPQDISILRIIIHYPLPHNLRIPCFCLIHTFAQIVLSYKLLRNHLMLIHICKMTFLYFSAQILCLSLYFNFHTFLQNIYRLYNSVILPIKHFPSVEVFYKSLIYKKA